MLMVRYETSLATKYVSLISYKLGSCSKQAASEKELKVSGYYSVLSTTRHVAVRLSLILGSKEEKNVVWLTGLVCTLSDFLLQLYKMCFYESLAN